MCENSPLSQRATQAGAALVSNITSCKYQSCFNFWWKAKTTLTTWDHVEKAELKEVFTTKGHMQSQEKAKQP